MQIIIFQFKFKYGEWYVTFVSGTIGGVCCAPEMTLKSEGWYLV